MALTVDEGVGSSARTAGAVRRACRLGAAVALGVGVWCLGFAATATALPPFPVPPVSIPPVAIPHAGPPPKVAVHVDPHGAHAGVHSTDGSGIDAGVSHNGVHVTSPGTDTQLPLPTTPSAPEQPVAVPPFPFPVGPTPGAASGAAPATAPAPATGSAATNSAPSGVPGSPNASRAPSVSAEREQVAGSIRSSRRSSWSRIGVEAATIAPWLALCVLALVMRAAGISAVRDRLLRRRSRVVS